MTTVRAEKDARLAALGAYTKLNWGLLTPEQKAWRTVRDEMKDAAFVKAQADGKSERECFEAGWAAMKNAENTPGYAERHAQVTQEFIQYEGHSGSMLHALGLFRDQDLSEIASGVRLFHSWMEVTEEMKSTAKALLAERERR